MLQQQQQGGDQQQQQTAAAAAPGQTPYVGEQVIYLWRFYRRVRVGAPRLLPIEFDGFVVEELGDVREYNTTWNGREFLVSEIRRALFPQEEGTLIIPSWQLQCQVAVEAPRSRRSLFDDFFGRQQVENRVLGTSPIELTVRPLPAALSGQDPVAAQDLEESRSVASEGEALDIGGEQPAAEAKPFEPGEVFVNANTVYEAGEYERAIELYGSLLDHGYENGYLHFNLGNAYLRNGELGRAIAAYRRSQVFLPRDQDVRANLDFARKSAKDALRPPAPAPVLATLFFWHYGLSRSELAVAVIVVNLLLWTILILRLYRRGSEVLRWTFMVLLLLLLATLGSLVVHYLWPQEIAVVVPQEIEVRSGTNVQDVVLFKLHAGTEVRVVDRREGSIRIALPEEGKGGWIGQEHAEVVVE